MDNFYSGGEIQGLSGQTAISVRLFLTDEKLKNMRSSNTENEKNTIGKKSKMRVGKEGEKENENDLNLENENENGCNEEKEGRNENFPEDINHNNNDADLNNNDNEKNNDNNNSNDNENNRNKNTSCKMNQSGRREIPGFGSGSATDSSDYTVPHIGNFYICRNCFHFIF